MWPYDDYEKDVGKLRETLGASGIPYDGIAYRAPRAGETAHFVASNGEPTVVGLVHAASTSAQQRQQLEAIAAQFKFGKRMLKRRAGLRQALDALPAKDFKDLLLELLLEKLASDPDFAARLGKPIDGDEPIAQQLKQ